MAPVVVLLCLLTAPVSVASNLVSNGDFEVNATSADWECSGCKLQLSTDSYSGQYSGYVTERDNARSGIRQTFAVQGGKYYYMRGYVKLLFNGTSPPYHEVTVKAFLGRDENGTRQEIYVSVMSFLQNNIWAEVGGDFVVPAFVKDDIRIFVLVDKANVNYLIDNVTVEELPFLTNFKAEADARIDQIRKQNVQINVSGEASLSNDTVVKLQLKKHSFIMGAMVQPGEFMDPQYKAYQDTLFDHFNYASLGNGIKWKQMEKVQGQVTYETPEKAVDYILSRGMKVRAHNIFWSGADHSPDWLDSLSGDDLKNAMMGRINQSAAYFKGRVSEWVVSNENTHLNWFEEKLKDPNITQWMFRETHKADPAAKLYLNDFRIMNDGRYTAALVNQAVMLKGAGVPLHGVSPQSHMKLGVDVTLMQHRLDRLDRAGLPIWVSELDIPYTNVSERAQRLEEALRLFFSHKSVIGVTLWGFWDQLQDSGPTKALFSGSQLTPNEAGQRFQALWEKEWTTNVTKPLSHGQTTVRAFKGDYSLQVLKGDTLLKELNFTLGDTALDLHVQVSGSGDTFSVPQILVG